MNRKDKSVKIGSILDKLYPETPVPLDHLNSYTLLVAVMLSAQTTDKKVNEVTPELFKLADSPEKMVKLKEEHIKEIIREIGLAPTKAKNIKKMAKQLIDGGGMRADWNYLESLSGVGHKTASVVMAQWYDIPAFPVDTHIHRLAARWGLSKAKNVEMTEKDLKKLWDKKKWNKRHLQIIFFGREYCPARNHDLKKCPICSWAASKKRIALETKI
ncbi:MAG: endonuclease III [Candidatus Marinimicrobia bacterium]|nr:endonuclease III [Candidatus Neomarinimicrobiota bacterium]|tara:strand:+ start:1285 stop:1929 length:645 start_codon:yes stop_codon:yes gene_type:complete